MRVSMRNVRRALQYLDTNEAAAATTLKRRMRSISATCVSIVQGRSNACIEGFPFGVVGTQVFRKLQTSLLEKGINARAVKVQMSAG